LTVRPSEVLSAEQLADVLWSEQPPASWAKVVQGCVVRLRKVLGSESIETTPFGYRLTIALDEIDAQRFERAVERSRTLLHTTGDPDRAAFVLTEALSLWRGAAMGDVEDWDAGRIEAGRLEELHLEAEELYVEARLRAGHADTVLARAEAMTHEQPLRERRWALLALAQYQTGRQTEALATLRRVRAVLNRELGLDPGPELEELEQAVLRQDPSLVEHAALPEPSAVCPYRGLLPYDTDDADTFFGRDEDVTACLRRLGASRVLAVVGPSGTGKSSMVRAGVVAALRRDGRDVLVMTPGPHPVETLALLPRRSQGTTLVVDQCEEVYSLCHDPVERTRFLDELVRHAARGALVVVLRADHLVDVSVHRDFAGLVEQGLHLMAGMREEELRVAVEEPARLAGMQVEPALVQILVQEVSASPGTLPMMSHALRETWQRREGRTLTVAGYQASGGIREAVARSAEDIYSRIDEDERSMLRHLLLRLVTPGAEGEPVRSRLPRRLVVTDRAHDEMVDLLVGSRLVTSDDGVVEIAHEALAREWPRLREWLEEDVEGQRLLHHLATAADSWDALGRPDSEVYRGVRLARVLDWRRRATPQLTETEQSFLEAGERLSQTELRSAEAQAHRERRANRRLRVLLAAAVVLLLAAATAGAYALRQSARATSEAAAADRVAVGADARRVGTRAQLSEDVSLSLLLATAGVRLADSPDTRVNLFAALDKHPKLVRSAPAGGGYIDWMDVSPDGRWIAAADDGGRMHLYDASTGDLLRSYSSAPPPGEQVFMYPAFSPDGRYLAVGMGMGDRDPVRLLDPRTMKPAAIDLTPAGREAAGVNDLQFSADGNHLAATLQTAAAIEKDAFSAPASVFVWDVRTPAAPPSRVSAGPGPQGLALSPDGRTAYTAWPLTAYDVESGDRLWRRDDVFSFAVLDVNTAGTLLALQLQDSPNGSTVALVDATTGRTVHRLAGHEDQPRSLRFSTDGRLLASASRDGEIIVWDVATGRSRDRWKTFEVSWSVAFSPNGSLVYTGGDDGMLRTWDVATQRTYLQSTAVHEVPDGYADADVSPDGRRVAYRWVDGETGSIRFVDIASGSSTAARPLPLLGEQLSPGAWRQDGSRYAGYAECPDSCPANGVVTVLDPVTGEVVATKKVVKGVIVSLAYIHDGDDLLVGASGGTLVVVDADTLLPLHAPFNVRSDCCMTPVLDDRAALMFDDAPDGASETWRVVDLSDGTVRTTGHLGFRVHDSTTSPDGSHVAVTGQSGEVATVDVRSGQQRKGSTALAAEGLSVRYSDDGSRIVTGSGDGAVTLWDGRTLQALGTVYPRQQGDPVSARADFGADHDVTIASYDGHTFTWDTDDDRAVDYACQMAGRNLTRDEWSEFLPEQPFREVCPVR
jgi:WD40 repeat protein/DNA-binding SARP family transcriptional activator